MSNPIKAIIIFEEGSGGAPLGCGCSLLLIVSICAVIFWGSITRSCDVLISGEDNVRLTELTQEKKKLEKDIKWEQDHGENDPKSAMDYKGHLNKLKKLKELNQEEEILKQKVKLKSENENIVKSSKITNAETDAKPRIENVEIDLSKVTYPATFQITSDSQFLASDGKETIIPSGTRILILKRTPTGMLSLEANGKTYLGYESRLIGKIKK